MKMLLDDTDLRTSAELFSKHGHTLSPKDIEFVNKVIIKWNSYTSNLQGSAIGILVTKEWRDRWRATLLKIPEGKTWLEFSESVDKMQLFD